jgi:hypothetical protein
MTGDVYLMEQRSEHGLGAYDGLGADTEIISRYYLVTHDRDKLCEIAGEFFLI